MSFGCCSELRVNNNARFAFPVPGGGNTSDEANSSGGYVFDWWEDSWENLVYPIDDGLPGAEILGQAELLNSQGAELLVVDSSQEGSDLGLTKTIDGLHRIADEEESTTVGFPTPG